MDPRAWKRFRKNKGALAGLVLVSVVAFLAIFGPWLAPHDYTEQDRVNLLDNGIPVGPGEVEGYYLGADTLGRDELSRLLQGGSVSLQVSIVATLIAVFLGLLIGVSSGYFGGFIDFVAMRIVDIALSFPFLLIIIAIQSVVESPGLWALSVILGLLSWTTLARVTRAKTMQVRELEYVQAARALGMSEARVLLKHVLPNVLGPAIVIGTTLVAQMIIVESAMSYLGFGVQTPEASWGSLLREGQDMATRIPGLLVYPSALIVMTVFGFNLLGEGLRDALDPKTQ